LLTSHCLQHPPHPTPYHSNFSSRVWGNNCFRVMCTIFHRQPSYMVAFLVSFYFCLSTKDDRKRARASSVAFSIVNCMPLGRSQMTLICCQERCLKQVNTTVTTSKPNIYSPLFSRSSLSLLPLPYILLQNHKLYTFSKISKALHILWY
jgi:hypothetical protein